MKSKNAGIKAFIPPTALYRDIVRSALLEDVGHGDITTSCTIEADTRGLGEIIAKEEGRLAGLFVAVEAFRQVDPGLSFSETLEEGESFHEGDTLIAVKGRASSILMAERVALNFLQRLCGIATLAKRYCEQIDGTGCRLVGTRKTTPNLRILEKYALRAGGAMNHRFSLSDGILIKDNHIAACGGISEAVRAARERAPHTLKIEVEVTDIEEMKEAISAGADAVLLDNMTPDEITRAAGMARQLKPGLLIEASGGINLENVGQFAAAGADIISSGALTHSFKSVDLSLKLKIQGASRA